MDSGWQSCAHLPLYTGEQSWAEREGLWIVPLPQVSLVPGLSLLPLVAGEGHEISHFKPSEGDSQRATCAELLGVSTEGGAGVSLTPSKVYQHP